MIIQPTFYQGTAFSELETVATPTIVDPWLAAGSVTLLFGPPSAGKTHVTLSLARAMIHGAPFAGFNCAKARVLVIQADMNTALYQERVREHTDALTPDFAVLTTDALPIDVMATGYTSPGIKEARAFDPDVIFVDTLRKTHNLDENDSAVPDRVYAAWRRLFPRAAFVFLHHSRKISNSPNANADTLVREAFRGTAAWAASADTLLMLKRVRKANNPAWMTRMHFVRTRSCEEPAPLLLRLSDKLILEPLADAPHEVALMQYMVVNPRAKRADAVKYLIDHAVCGQATAYRAWDKLMRGML